MALIKTNARSASALDATILTGNIPALNGSAVTNLTSGNLTGALPAISGASLTGISGAKVLQIIKAQGGAELMTSSTFNSTGLYATITPASSSNAILVTATTPRSYNNGTERLSFALCRGTTGEGSGGVILQGTAKASSSSLVNTTQILSWYDLPSSTSANTYTVMHKNDNNSTLVGWFESGGTANAQIILMEIEV